MATTYNVLRPFRDYDEHEVIQGYALDTTGLAGKLVKVTQGNLDQDSYWANGEPVGGVSHDGVYSNFFKVNATVAGVGTGDSKNDILGMTIVDVRTVDDLGRPLWDQKRIADELVSVYSGQSVPVVRRGLFQMKSSEVEGDVTVGGYLVPASGSAGKIAVVPQSRIWTGAKGANNATTTKQYNPDQIVGKVVGTGNHVLGSTSGVFNFVLDLQ